MNSMKEHMIALAKLERERKDLESQFLTDLQSLTYTLEKKYAPELRRIKEAISQHRQLLKEHAKLSDEIYWRIYDSCPHDTDTDTTTRMRRNFKRQQHAKEKYS